MVHGSLTPENIFITKSNGRIKVADFGIRRAVSEPSEQRAKWLFDPSSGFTAPEVLMGGSSSEISDIYQIGLLMLFMLSAEPPSPGKGLAAALENLAGAQRTLSQISGKIPKYLDDIIRRCLEKDPLMRFSSIDELAAALRSRSVPDRRTGFMDMLETDYTSFEEAEIKKEPAPKPAEEPQKPALGIFPDDLPLEKDDRMSLVKWVFFSVWVAVAAGIIYSLINILLLGE